MGMLNIGFSATPLTGQIPLGVIFSFYIYDGTPPYYVQYIFESGKLNELWLSGQTYSFSRSHTYFTEGADIAMYAVQDATGASLVKSITITPYDQPPTEPPTTPPTGENAPVAFVSYLFPGSRFIYPMKKVRSHFPTILQKTWVSFELKILKLTGRC